MASSAWLVTTTSASAAVARARSAKHVSPNGQRDAPTHSRDATLTWRHAWSTTPRARESRSPSSVSSAHSWSRATWEPTRDTADGSSSASASSTGSGMPLILLRHR